MYFLFLFWVFSWNEGSGVCAHSKAQFITETVVAVLVNQGL